MAQPKLLAAPLLQRELGGQLQRLLVTVIDELGQVASAATEYIKATTVVY
jgi:hypothetical protein